MSDSCEIAVVGGGLAGMTAALAAASRGYRTSLIAPAVRRADGRTTALMMPSIDMLAELDVWPKVSDTAAPLRSMRIIDSTRRLIRAPTVTFHASELDIDAFGYNIPNSPLLKALLDRAMSHPGVRIVEASLDAAVETDQGVELLLDSGETILCRLAVGADGRNSTIRSAAGIGVHDWRYPQTALVLNFSHQFPHANTSNEFHTEQGPFTQVPLPGLNSSLVWAREPSEADAMRALSPEVLAEKIEMQMQSMLGRVTVESEVQCFPFSGMIARSFGRGRMPLVGEAGHVFPPIGAQGLNLGLRDVLDLVSALEQAGGPDNAHDVVQRYDKSRRNDVVSRTASVDMLNRSLLHSFLPVQLLRSTGLAALSAIPPLRNFAMREGMEPGSGFGLLKDWRPEKYRREASRS
ncbi:UbiH/UbiF family hydroxylase [Hoeflea prorocentri]|uniref:UbiH/UbiF family hydroxylase n=1 Tax=Hoeflea prorocentri TaxID=1922333 RepID=A0A9X3UKF3_9HYPH|nr:UbiH/UbiF family hydroxylase [Hoeflea prorocentri]MCY6380779.1 UbiH/UbiF family hydroxylase [Hoeflea prorocentri]MDA5398579.1 UbiH/UbiF family hydroxylase [Hoeflea prorocentri]